MNVNEVNQAINEEFANTNVSAILTGGNGISVIDDTMNNEYKCRVYLARINVTTNAIVIRRIIEGEQTFYSVSAAMRYLHQVLEV